MNTSDFGLTGKLTETVIFYATQLTHMHSKLKLTIGVCRISCMLMCVFFYPAKLIPHTIMSDRQKFITPRLGVAQNDSSPSSSGKGVGCFFLDFVKSSSCNKTYLCKNTSTVGSAPQESFFLIYL